MGECSPVESAHLAESCAMLPPPTNLNRWQDPRHLIDAGSAPYPHRPCPRPRRFLIRFDSFKRNCTPRFSWCKARCAWRSMVRPTHGNANERPGACGSMGACWCFSWRMGALPCRSSWRMGRSDLKVGGTSRVDAPSPPPLSVLSSISRRSSWAKQSGHRTHWLAGGVRKSKAHTQQTSCEVAHTVSRKKRVLFRLFCRLYGSARHQLPTRPPSQEQGVGSSVVFLSGEARTGEQSPRHGQRPSFRVRSIRLAH